MATEAPSRRIPDDVVNLNDYARHAQACLPEGTWAYLSGGAADEHTLRANEQAWAAWQLHPRVLQPLQGAHLRTTLLGRPLAHPVMLAPVAAHTLAHPDGERGVAYAAAAQSAGLVLSTQASTRLEDVAQAYLSEAHRGPLWMQLYQQADRGATLALVQRAEAAGYEALVVTVDAPTNGARDRERRAQFQMPAGTQVNLTSPRGTGAAPSSWDTLMDQAPTWADIAWLQSQTRLPLLLKGVLHEADAREALARGVQGLIVSNHGGRTLDTAVSTAWALPRIAEAVDGQLSILVDGGIRRGTDVLKALALGAQAVLIGRPYVYALATAGALGVAHVLRLLQDELAIALALCGCASVAELHRDLLVRA